MSVASLINEAHEVLSRLQGLEPKESAIAIALVKRFVQDIEDEPNSAGLAKAAHALSWHISDQIEPLPFSLAICGLSNHARNLAKN